MSNCKNFTYMMVSDCGSTLPSTCVVLSKTFSYHCENSVSCFKTLEDLLRYWKPIICDAKHALDISSLNRTCYTSNSNTGLTLVALLQELIDMGCANKLAITDVANSISSYIPNYNISTTVDFKCTWNDACVNDKPLTLQTSLQRIIDKICSINTRLSTLENTVNSLPWSYKITYSNYPCITPNNNKSDLENLFKAVQDICFTYGSNGMSSSLAYIGATSLAQAISMIWTSISALKAGSSGGSGSTVGFSSDFILNSNNLYYINPISVKQIINQGYVVGRLSAGANITIDNITGEISASAPALTLTATTNAATLASNALTVRQKRDILYESSLAGTVPGNDASITYTSVVVTTTTNLFFTQTPANVAAGPNATVIIVDSYVTGTGVSKRLIPGIHYTILPGRVGITLVTGVVAGQIIDVTYF